MIVFNFIDLKVRMLYNIWVMNIKVGVLCQYLTQIMVILAAKEQ